MIRCVAPAFLSSGGSVSIAPSPCCYLSPPSLAGGDPAEQDNNQRHLFYRSRLLLLLPGTTTIAFQLQSHSCTLGHAKSTLSNIPHAFFVCPLLSLRWIKCPIIISINNKRARQIKLLNRFQILYFNWPPQPVSHPVINVPFHLMTHPHPTLPGTLLLQHLLVRFAFVYSNSALFLLNRTNAS